MYKRQAEGFADRAGFDPSARVRFLPHRYAVEHLLCNPRGLALRASLRALPRGPASPQLPIPPSQARRFENGYSLQNLVCFFLWRLLCARRPQLPLSAIHALMQQSTPLRILAWNKHPLHEFIKKNNLGQYTNSFTIRAGSQIICPCSPSRLCSPNPSNSPHSFGLS
ncbi:MAG: hypothetical protein N2035_10375 [Chthoniobacterales bacterium]|nr:hypothetical protein [Chthoniobacterales bacterium]